MRQSLRRILPAFSVSLMMAFSVLVSATSGAQNLPRDCDDNSVLRCGAHSVEELKTKYRQNQNGNTHQIFNHFGISNESMMDGMVVGRVTKTNRVYVGDTLVATDAVTVGRQNIAGSTPILNGAAYERPPSVSFNQSELPALVKMNGTTFQYAVISSCGNPMKATPKQPIKPPPVQKQTPKIKIVKEVREPGEMAHAGSEKVDAGATVEFEIVVRNSGRTTLQELTVRDVLPAGLTYIPNSLRVDGAEMSGSQTLFTQNGFVVETPLAPGDKVVIEYSAAATAGASATGANTTFKSATSTSSDITEDDNESSDDLSADSECHQTTYRNRAIAIAQGVNQVEDEATVIVESCRDISKPTAELTGIDDTPQVPSVSDEKPAPAPSTSPSSLPATGPASVAGVFSAVSLLGMAAHRLKEFFLGIL